MINDFQKSQFVRILDFTLIGPLLIHIGTKNQLTKFDKSFLVLIGIATIFYNLNNFALNKKFPLGVPKKQ
mgnify:CR=1 FL=1|tara:strand:- start:907 stop:1116 length:210 start_codon:yes stop_codon:yes gene_type:complete